MAIEIVDWGKHYENHRTRELKRMEWVPLPNRQDGDGYTTLLDHPNGAAHFGAWCALVQVAARCKTPTECRDGADEVPTDRRRTADTPPINEPKVTGIFRDSGKYDKSDHPHGRGILVKGNGEPHNVESLERMTRVPARVWEEALPRLVTIGWIRGYTASAPPADVAPTKRRCRADQLPNERNGMEWNGTEIEPRRTRGTKVPPSVDLSLYHSAEEAFLSRNDGRFTDYPKEGAALKGLVKKARARAPDAPADFLLQMITAFWGLRCTGNSFWQGQPFTPSALNASAIWDRVLETMRNDERGADPVAMAVARGETI